MFERLKDSKLNVIFGAAGSGKSISILYFLNKLKDMKNIAVISENQKKYYKSKFFQIYGYLNNYMYLFKKNIEQRLAYISEENIDVNVTESLDNIEFIDIFKLDEKGIKSISNFYDYIFIDNIDLLQTYRKNTFDYDFLINIKSKLFITKNISRHISENRTGYSTIFNLPNDLMCRASMIFETKVENKNLDIVCHKNKYGNLNKITLPLYNMLY